MANNKLVNIRQIFSAGRKDGFFYVTSNLGPAKAADGVPPMETYAKWSRFHFNIVIGGKSSVRANLKPTEVADPKLRTQFAYQKHLEAECSSFGSVGTGAAGGGNMASPAYSVKFGMGTLKGKSPAEVLMENPANVNMLLTQKEFLAKNADKYPKNREQMNAIDDAINLLNAGMLSAESAVAASNPPITIFESDLQPQATKLRQDGKTLVYTMKITFTPGDKSPVYIEIVNFYAPSMRTPDGRVIVKAGDKSDEVRYTRNLTSSEWAACVDALESNMRQFEIVYAKALFEEAEAEDTKQREANGITGRNASSWGAVNVYNPNGYNNQGQVYQQNGYQQQGYQQAGYVQRPAYPQQSAYRQSVYGQGTYGQAYTGGYQQVNHS